MKEAMEIDEIRETAANLFRGMFAKNALVEVVVKPGLDWEGDKILNIIFVFDETKKMLDIKKSIKLGSLVRDQIVVEEDCFPMIKFANTEDARVMRIGSTA
ncbi:MAG: hypothetical protein OXF24_00820 [Hyphomicrobiales bacterium]|nr:hypothetical protein [Hyphomicrobiales bacterium]